METYYGHVRTPADAIILFEACRIGLLPRVQRRLSEKERQSIRSGSVFVWDEREAGMRRWTDGKSWSASRVSGSFLTYREMEGKRGGSTATASTAPTTASSSSTVSRAGKTPDSARGSDDDRGEPSEEGPDGYRYKPDGLMKQSFSITTSTGQHLHLISYYSRSHPSAANLQQPSTDPALRHVRPQKGLYPESTVNDQQNLPVVTRGPMAGAAAYPITPHPLGGYPRSGATHPQSYTPPYGWPPTPMGTPTVSVQYGGGGGYLPPLPPATNGQVPYGQHQHPALPPPPPQSALPYDRSLERSPPYATMPPNPRIASPHTQTRLLPQTTAPPSSLHSPRLLKQVPGNPTLPILAPPATTKPSTEVVVPPIGALINGAPPPPPPVTMPMPAPVTAVAVSAAAAISAPPVSARSIGLLDPTRRVELPRAGASPHAGRAEGPKDIPSDKIGFGGEDIRALRELDRVFTA
ncbi:hypothetical protein ASPZODRAFT_12241 [Penicilliopsis zonata CBS 506.65]|uniref:cAMP-independent regulatory protein pac2 n=1 Tax=Penicilliopsis zonata CBS 506.65 TaxID=1073090 RepID=A0A1L9SW58_9EURO|nr:hypothetical protein ASPZODRAFT_12241 [Penicilliopsis zonata CBS 506.65]OJJ51416.1 hypothetical protein ASPZODRAFT_12241 [Penicilliopsis zonata CBS 506.65]